MNRITQVIKRHPQMTFWAIAIATFYFGYYMYVRTGSQVWQFAIWGSFLGGALVTGIADGRSGLKVFFGRIVRWRVGLKWYAVALLLPLAARLVAFGLTLASGATLPETLPAISWADLLFEFLLVFFVVALGEEPGFRGFALPRLMIGRTALLASLVLGVLHTIWHLPAFIAGEDPPIVVLVIMAGSVLNTWLFNNTYGSVLLVMLLHASVNLWVGIFNPLFTGADLARQTVWLALVYVVVAVLLVVLAGPELGRKREAILPPVPGEGPARGGKVAAARGTRERKEVNRMSTTIPPAALGARRPQRRSRARTWLTRGSLVVATALLGLGALGAIYQAIAASNDRRALPPPGELVDIGGRRLHMVVMGQDTGLPTVVLEAGMAAFSSNFHWVQQELAATTRVVSYDRAGLGWSDPAPAPQDAFESARDLHAALQAAGVGGPYVVAGHSYGGLVVRAFTDLYPGEVSGMVLIDASHPDQWANIPPSRNGKLNGSLNLVTGFLARLGVVRLFQLERASYRGLPERPAAEMAAILARPESWQTSGQTLMIWNDRTRPQINAARSLDGLPLAVIGVTEQPLFGDVLARLQDELSAMSDNTIHITEAGATHENLVANEGHARAVARTIRQVLEAAQSGRPLSEVAGTTQ